MSKNKFNIDELNDTNDIIKKIVNQVNSLNKKIKTFREEGVTEHYDYVKALIGDSMIEYNDTGTISKSKKQFEGQHIMSLKRTLSAVRKMNNHDFYGTVNKYRKELTRQVQDVKDYAEEYLTKNSKYDEEFINSVINEKEFYTQLWLAFGDVKKNSGFTSEQAIDKVFLNYKNNPINDKEKNKILNRIEFSINTKQRNDKRQALLNQLEESERNETKR